MEIADWLERLLPEARGRGEEDGCWVAHMKARTPAHHPPLYWLGRALDAVEEAGAIDAMRGWLLAAHGAASCAGWSEQDQRAQDVLTAACALAWAAEHLGPPEPVEVNGGERLLVRVPSLDVSLAPRRLWAPPGPARMPPMPPTPAPQTLLSQLSAYAAEAASDLAPARGRILYVDLNLHRGPYARDIGYQRELTEPIRTSVKHHGADQRLGWVLTRPFEWGVPIEVWY